MLELLLFLREINYRSSKKVEIVNRKFYIEVGLRDYYYYYLRIIDGGDGGDSEEDEDKGKFRYITHSIGQHSIADSSLYHI